MYRRLPILLTLFLTLAVSFVLAQDSACPAIVEAAIQGVGEFCAGAGRNQACYGHINMTAQPQPDAANFSFTQIGDVVDVAAIKSLKLAGLDTTAGVWGVALMKIQANLPSTLPGQNVTFLLFGDTEIRNAADSVAAQSAVQLPMTINSGTNVNVRVGPGTNAAIVTTAAPGQQVIATGRNEDGAWVRVQIDNLNGWIFTDLLQTDGDISALSVVSADAGPQYGPLQAFYLSTGIGEPLCNEVPGDGLLIQTPEGAGNINLLVNAVEIEMGSTVVIRSQPGNQMRVSTIEGTARGTFNSKKSTAPAGSQFTIPIDENNNARGEPGDAESYDLEDFEGLPVEVLERDIEIADPLTDEEIAFLHMYDDVFDFVDLEDADDLLNYLDEGGEDVLSYLLDELDYDFDDLVDDEDLFRFFDEDLDYDMDEYDDFEDEDFDADTSDDANEVDGGDDSGVDDSSENDAGSDDTGDDVSESDDTGDDGFGGDDSGGEDGGE